MHLKISTSFFLDQLTYNVGVNWFFQKGKHMAWLAESDSEKKKNRKKNY